MRSTRSRPPGPQPQDQPSPLGSQNKAERQSARRPAEARPPLPPPPDGDDLERTALPPPALPERPMATLAPEISIDKSEPKRSADNGNDKPALQRRNAMAIRRPHKAALALLKRRVPVDDGQNFERRPIPTELLVSDAAALAPPPVPPKVAMGAQRNTRLSAAEGGVNPKVQLRAPQDPNPLFFTPAPPQKQAPLLMPEAARIANMVQVAMPPVPQKHLAPNLAGPAQKTRAFFIRAPQQPKPTLFAQPVALQDLPRFLRWRPFESNAAGAGAVAKPAPHQHKQASVDDGQGIDRGMFYTLRLTEKNYSVHDRLTRLAGGKPPMMLISGEDSFFAIPTPLKGGYGKIFVGINKDGNLVGIKEIRDPAEVAQARAVGLRPTVRGTKEADVKMEANLTRHLAPGLNSRKLIQAPNNRTYIVMDFMPVSGQEALYRSADKKKVGRLLFFSAAQKLAKIHAKGFAHRDVKLENLLVGQDGAVEVSDFGMATNEATVGQRWGTYVSPEIVKPGGEQTTATDVYALCASLMESFNPVGTKGPFYLGYSQKELEENQKAIETFRNFELHGVPLRGIQARAIAERFSAFKRADPQLYYLIVVYGLEPDPKKRITMDHLVLRLEALNFNEQNREAARRDMRQNMLPQAQFDYYNAVAEQLKALKQVVAFG